MALWGAAVSVVTWSAGAAPEPACGSVLPESLVATAGDSYGLSGWKITQKNSRADSYPPPVFSPQLVVAIEIVRTLRLYLGIEGRLV